MLVLLVGLAVSLNLIKIPQIFNSHASGQAIIIKDQNGNPLPQENGVPITNSTNVKIHLNAPDAP